jgi:hypothetical protein
LIIILVSLRLNYVILQQSDAFVLGSFIKLPKRNLSSVLSLAIAFWMIILVGNLPAFYVSLDCSSTIYMTVPSWMFVFDEQSPQRDHSSCTFDMPQLFYFSFFLIGFTFYCFLKNSGIINITTVSILGAVSKKKWWSFNQIVLGCLFIMFSVTLAIRLWGKINALIEAKEFDKDVVIGFSIFEFFISFIYLGLIFLYGLWVFRDGVLLKKSLSRIHFIKNN